LMVLWRIWHVRNEIVHAKQPPPMGSSWRFLVSYLESLLQIKCHQGQDIVKGKLVLEIDGKQPQKLKEKTTEPSWTPPREGWVKWNTDGSFDSGGEAGAGIVVLSSCKQLQGCLWSRTICSKRGTVIGAGLE
jgi:hypothetical protein